MLILVGWRFGTRPCDLKRNVIPRYLIQARLVSCEWIEYMLVKYLLLFDIAER